MFSIITSTATTVANWFRKSPPGLQSGYSYGGGPVFADAFNFRRAPSPPLLVESFKSLIYACATHNAMGVSAAPLRMFIKTSRGQSRAKYAECKSLSRRAQTRLKGMSEYRKVLANADEIEEVVDHPLLTGLLHCNPEMDLHDTIYSMCLSMDIVGTAYVWGFLQGNSGVPSEYWVLPPHWVYPIFSTYSMIPDTYQFGGLYYDKDELIRCPMRSLKNGYGPGYSPAHAACEYARLEDTFVSIQDDMLSNGPRPSILISPKDAKASIGEAERKRAIAELNQKSRGGRAGAAIMVDGAIDVTPLSYDPADLSGMEISKYNMERIANCFHVPISFLTDESSNRANATTGIERHAREAVVPRHKAIAAGINRYIHSLDPTGKKGYDRLFVAFDSVIQEDKELAAKIHTIYGGMGVLTYNEIREEIDRDPLPDGWGEQPLVPGTLMTIDQILNPPEPEPMDGTPAEQSADDEEEPAETKKQVSDHAAAKVLERVADLLPRVAEKLK